MKALIFEGKVIDIVENEFEVHESLSFVDCNDTIEVGYTYSDGTFTAPETYTPTYDQSRKDSYPSIGEQLDMQYWDAVNGTTTWKDAIAQVKADNPKPE